MGADILNSTTKEDPSFYLDIFREVEAVKRNVDKTIVNKVIMTLPRAQLDEICINQFDNSFAAVIKKSQYKEKIEVRYDKLRIDLNIMKHILMKASGKIEQLITNTLKSVPNLDVSVIVLVGGVF